MLSVIYLFLVFLSCIFGLLSENSAAVGAAALSGAQDGVRLTVAISGAICIWSALQKTMEASGLTNFVSMIRTIDEPRSSGTPAGQDRGRKSGSHSSLDRSQAAYLHRAV